jgi:hypothetical protein
MFEAQNPSHLLPEYEALNKASNALNALHSKHLGVLRLHASQQKPEDKQILLEFKKFNAHLSETRRDWERAKKAI